MCDSGGSVVAARGAALYCCLLRGATEAIEYRGASHSKAGFATSVSAVKHAHCYSSTPAAAYFDGCSSSALARRRLDGCTSLPWRGAAGRRWRLESRGALAVILYTAVVFALRTTSNLQLAVAPSNDRLIHKVIHQQGAVSCLVNR